jgi:catechol 2,3-dioxygenase-like lactoylglutathione lyase family enzyme
MQLGNFCLCLAVKDIHASKAFYERLGFKPVSGNIDHKWLVLKNGDTKIGLFQGMFEGNLLTFNPGWDSMGQALPSYTDVREIQRALKAAGVTFTKEADESSTGPAHCTLVDPDGNAILFDQHV